MDPKCNISVKNLGVTGFDNRTAPLVDLARPRHVIVKEETALMPTSAEGGLQKPDEKSGIISGEDEHYSVAEARDFPVLIDFEKICLWDHDGDVKVGIRMEDPEYMKKRLLEWVHAVGAYARFLQATADIR